MQTASVALPAFNEPIFYTSYLDHYRSPLDLRSQSNLSSCSLSDISSLYSGPSCAPSSQTPSRNPSFSSSTLEGMSGIQGVESQYSMDGVEEALFEGSIHYSSHGNSANSLSPGLSDSHSSSMLLAQGQVMMPNIKQEKMISPSMIESQPSRNLRYGENELMNTSREDVNHPPVCTDVVARARKALQQRQQMLLGGEGPAVSNRSSPSSDSPSPPSSPCSPLDEEDSNDRYQLAKANQNKQVANKIGGHTFMDITPYMTLPQAEAARRLGIPPSTLSKRWRVAARKRKWPWRVVSKLDKEITTLMYNITPGETLDKEVEERLAYLMQRRQKELRPVSIRI